MAPPRVRRRRCRRRTRGAGGQRTHNENGLRRPPFPRTVRDMLHRLSRAALVLAATAALALPAVATATAPGPTEREPSPRWAEITRVPGGFRYLASLHDSNLTIRKDAGRVVFHDRAMRRFREALPNGCRRVTVEVGI